MYLDIKIFGLIVLNGNIGQCVPVGEFCRFHRCPIELGNSAVDKSIAIENGQK